MTDPVMLPDLLEPHLRLVVCGSAAGTASERAAAYYAGRGNRFWETLAAVGLTPRVLAPSEFRCLRDYGIGLTDLVKHQSGNDDMIRFDRHHGTTLSGTILQWQPAYLAFNGKRAAKEYLSAKTMRFGLLDQRIGETRLFVAPSTSGAARASWDVEVWRELAELVRTVGPR
jgi:double-stranded uracil-DNA glycosylase